MSKPISQNPDKLTKRATRILDAMRDGATLCVKNARDLGLDDSFESRSFWLEPTGKSAAPTAVDELIRKNKIAENGDGLFDGCSQTWRLRA